MMNCKGCGAMITEENQDPWLGKSWCNRCGKKYRSDYNTRWAKSHRSIVNRRVRTRYLKVKLAAMQALGGKCNCALEGCWHLGPCLIADHRILQFDHFKGVGQHEGLEL